MKVRAYMLLLSLVLCAVMLSGALPFAAAADGPSEEQPLPPPETNPPGSAETAEPAEDKPESVEKTPPRIILAGPRVDGLTVKIGGITLPEDTGDGSGIESVELSWDWGDGCIDKHRFPASHTYQSYGEYLVAVTARQGDGLTCREFVHASLVLPPSPPPDKDSQQEIIQARAALPASTATPPTTTTAPPPPTTTSTPKPTPSATPKPLDLSRVTFPENEGGSISGHVYQPGGAAPAPDVKISAELSLEVEGSSGTFTKEAYSASDGSYSVSGLPSGSYRVKIESSGFISRYYSAANDPALDEQVQVNMPGNTRDIDFTLDRGGSISGYVLQPDGTTSVSGAEVFAKSSQGYYMSATSSADGSYTLSGLLSGSYRVWVETPGYTPEYYNNALDYASATPVEVDLPGNTPGIDFVLDRGSSVSGRVYQTGGTTPVAGAQVTAISTEGKHNAKAISSQDGTYEITGLLSGHYVVEAKAEGFVTEYFYNQINQSAAMEVWLPANSNLTYIDFTLDPGGSISGHISRAENGASIAGAGVFIKSTGNKYQEKTASDTEGNYTFSCLPNGDYLVSTEVKGYLPEYYNHAAGSDLATPVSLNAPENISGIDFALDSGGSISGHVYLNDESTPFPGALVFAKSGNDVIGGAFSSSTGAYLISALPAGIFSVYAGAAGYLTEYYYHSYFIASPVNVNAPSDTPDIDLVLRRGGSISGRIYQADGETPLPGARVTLTPGPSGSSGSQWITISDQDGNYGVSNLRPANYSVYAQAEGYLGRYFDGVFSSSSATYVSVTYSSNVTETNITLDSGGSISGSVYREDGVTPIPGAHVYASSIEGYFGGETYSSGDGSYRIPGLASGHFRIYASAGGYLREYFGDADTYSNATPVAVNSPADTPDINFTLGSGGSISGRIYQADGETPLSGARVYAYSSDSGYNGSAYSSSDGSYMISTLSPGNYKVYAECSGYLIQYFDGAENSENASPVNVSRSGNTENIDFTLNSGGSISGRVFKEDGITPVQAIIYAVIGDNQYGRHAISATDGSYAISLLSPGNYFVYAYTDDYPRQYFNHTENLTAATPVGVILSENTPDIDFSLQPGGSISGHIYQSDGQTPLSGVYIYASLADGSCSENAYSLNDGSYIIRGLSSGPYTVYAYSSEYPRQYYRDAEDSSGAEPVIVNRPGNTPDIDFSLEKGASISGHVYRSDGVTPLAGAHVYIEKMGEYDGKETHSLSDGSYSISSLTAGNYRVSASASGYIEEYFDNILKHDSATPIKVISHTDTPDINFTLDTGGSISGHVYQADGISPVSGAWVYASGINGTGGVSTYSQPDGSYVILRVPAGNYRIFARADEYIQEYFENSSSSGSYKPVPVTGVNNTAGIDFTLDRGGSISGRIYREDGQTPISDAHVYAALPNGSSSKSTESSADGSYRITGLASGSYIVRAYSSDYVYEYYGGSYDQYNATEIGVVAPDDTSGIDIALDKGGTISGRVYQSDGTTPISGAYIQAGLNNGNYYEGSTSSSDGSYVISGLPSGDYVVHAQASGYLQEYFDGSYDQENATGVGVTAPNDTPGINLSLDKGGSISGHVYRADGITPIAGAEVYAESPRTGHYTTTDSSGSYCINELTPGSYTVYASADDYIEQYFDRAESSSGATPVVVAVSADTPGINFNLAKGGSISGHVYQADGSTPIAGASVYAYPSSTGGSAATDSSGRYYISGLSSGSYIVRATLSGYVYEYYNGSYDQNNSAEISVVAPNETSGIDFTLDRGGTISGRVYQSDGATPISGAYIYAELNNSSYYAYSRSSSDGSFVISGLPSGDYIVHAEASGYLRDYFNGSYDRESATEVGVTAPNDTSGIDFTLDKGGSISGHVYKTDGVTPVSEAIIDVFIPSSGYIDGVISASDGSYVVSSLASGIYILRVQEDRYISEYYDGAYDRDNATEVSVAAPNDTPGIDFTLDIGGTISGHVYQSDGTTPIAGADIYAYSSITGESTSTDSSGRYRITGLPGGSYIVRAQANYYITQYFDKAESSSTAVSVAVVMAADTPGINFSLTKGGSISGHVYRADATTPIAGAYVYAYSSSTAESTTSDSTGNYCITGLPSGSYTVLAQADDYLDQYYDMADSSSGATPVAVVLSEDTPHIDFSLIKGGSISGHVYRIDGTTPIKSAYLYASSSSAGRSATSDSSGKYCITGLPSGSYTVRARADDYFDLYYDEADSSSSATPVAVVLSEDTPNIDFSLIRGGSISGHVYQANGTAPIAEAEIYVYSSSTGQYTTTDSFGSYSITGLLSGSYNVRARKNGYLDQYFRETESSSGAAAVDVVISIDTPNIDFRLNKGGSISGHVYQEDGTTPVIGAEVYASSLSKEQYATTDSLGSYCVSGLTSGSYTVRAYKSGYLNQYFYEAESSSGATAVAVVIFLNTPDIDFKLQKGGSISGHVYQIDGKTPISNARIYLTSIEAGSSYTQTSGAAGEYNIKTVNPGDCIIRAEASGYVTQYYKKFNQDKSLALPVTVTMHNNTPDIDFALEKSGSISGYVYEADGITPILGAQITASPQGAGNSSRGTSQVDGSFSIASLSPGLYTVYASSSGYITEYYADSIAKPGTPVAVLLSQDTTGIDFTLEKGGSISGHVYMADGSTPVIHAVIEAYLTDQGYSHMSVSGADGSYTISLLPPGEYKVVANSQEGDCIPEYYKGSPDSGGADPVAVANLANTPNIDFTLDRCGSISGHIYQAAGKTPVFPASIRAESTTWNKSDNKLITAPQGKVLPDGSFAISGLIPGDYKVSAQAAGYLTEYYGGTYNLTDAIQVPVDIASDIQNIDFSLDPGGKISGRVYQSDGATPLPDAIVYTTDGNKRSASTNQEGSYIIDSLPTDVFEVSAYASGYAGKYYNGVYYREEATPVNVVAPNTTANIDFILEKSGSISGLVYGPDGQSLVMSSFSVSAIRLDPGTIPTSIPYHLKPGSYSSYGFYIVGDLIPGRYILKLTAKNYVDEYYGGAATAEQATVIDIAEGDQKKNFDFRLVALPAAVSTNITSSPNPSTPGQLVTFTASVMAVPPAAGIPTGSLTFTEGTSAFGTWNLSDTGLATWNTSSLSPGLHTLCASYTGDDQFAASTWNYTHTVYQPAGSGGSGGGGTTYNKTYLTGLTSTSSLQTDSRGILQTAARLTTSDGKITLDIAKGTKLLTSSNSPLTAFTAAILVSPPVPPPSNVLILAYTFGPEGAKFDPAITLSMAYDPAKLPAGLSGEDLYLAFFDGAQWQPLESKVNLETGTVSASISHFSSYALLGKAALPTPTPSPSPSSPSPTPSSPPPVTPSPLASRTPEINASPTTALVASPIPTMAAATSAVPATIAQPSPPAKEPDENSRKTVYLIISVVAALVVVLAVILIIWQRNATGRKT